MKNKKQNRKIDFKGLQRVLNLMFKTYTWSCVFVVLGIIVYSISLIIVMTSIQNLIDNTIIPMTNEFNQYGSVDYSPLIQQFIFMATILIAGTFCSWFYSRIMVNVSNGTLLIIRKKLFEKMESLTLRYFDTTKHGDTMSVYTNDIDTLRQLLSQGFPQFVDLGLSAITSFICLMYLSVHLTILCLFMIALMMIVLLKLGGSATKYFRDQQKGLANINAFIEEMIKGQKVVKSFCHEEENKKSYDVLNNHLFNVSSKANVFSSIIMPICGNMGNVTYVLVSIVGGLLAINTTGIITIGSLIAFLTLTKSFTRIITQLSMQMTSIATSSAGAGRVWSLMDQVPEENNGKTKIDKEKSKGEVIFKNVNFGYNQDKQILFDINIDAKPGKKIAIVGNTGAGKTTITNLITRFYDIDSGSITLDGVPIKEIDKQNLRSNIGLVLQDTHLYNTTVLENIRYGRLDATDEECIEAAKSVYADEFISHMPNKYDTELKNDAANLSQGQRQLIAIARAAISDPLILILDEATSSIDTKTERAVQKGMDKLMQGRTSFVIAHRLSTIKNADCIMVMQEGKIIESGSHEQLLENKGRYYHLYTGK